MKRTAKSTAQLMNQVDENAEGHGIPRSLHDAIPISSVPSLSREATEDDVASRNAATNSNKRQRLEEILPDDFDDDEAALISAEHDATQSPAKTVSVPSKAAPDNVKKAPALSEGVAAALAKYRSNA